MAASPDKRQAKLLAQEIKTVMLAIQASLPPPPL